MSLPKLMHHITSIFILVFSAASIHAQETWDHYLATYEDGLSGSTTLRMDLIDEAPMKLKLCIRKSIAIPNCCKSEASPIYIL